MSNQMEMTFASGENSLKRNFDTGTFTIFIEHDTPGADIAPEAAGARLTRLDEAVGGVGNLSMALAITDRYNYANSHRAVEYAGALPPERRASHLVYLSGGGTSPEEFAMLLHVARNSGLANIVPVSGDLRSEYGVYTESVRALKMMGDKFTGAIHAGAVVNPYKYRADAQFSQFFKLVKKLEFGAQFVVTQAGWDIRKLQSLKWYMEYRNLVYPTVARLMLLTPDKLDRVRSGHYPGIAVSPDFDTILNHELAFSSRQFEAAQWRRLELQVAGCRLLGYSGVQIHGIDTPDGIRLASMRLGAALREFATFDQWVEEYHSYQSKAEMAPIPQGFMMFDGLLTRQYYDTSIKFKQHPVSTGTSGAFDKFRCRLASVLFKHADSNRASRRRLLKKLIVGCSGCNYCRLPRTGYVCIGRCPKGLSNGSCGGVRADGRCENGKDICVFTFIASLSERFGILAGLENEYLPGADESPSL